MLQTLAKMSGTSSCGTTEVVPFRKLRAVRKTPMIR